MRLQTTYAGGSDPFEGDRVVILRALPAGALVRRAVLTVSPAASAHSPPFQERFVFGAARAGELPAADWGITAVAAGTAVEVDMHARRIAASVAGARVTDAALTVDIGGLFVDLNDRGTMLGPDDAPWRMQAGGLLPGVTTARFRLTGAQQAPVPDELAVRAVPANITVRLGTIVGPFWTHAGELTSPASTPDFAGLMNAFLLTARVEAGAYPMPFTIHADGIARLDLALDVEYLLTQSLTPARLDEVALPFDHGTFARTGGGALSVRLPAGAKVEPGLTTARVRGAFDATRIAPGTGTGDAPVVAEVAISAGRAIAQPVQPAADVIATGIDLCLAPLGPAARLSLTVMADADGTPFGQPLLPAPIEFALAREDHGGVAWITVALDAPLTFVAGRRVWLVAQAVTGEAVWATAAAAATATGDVALQVSVDGGLSWSQATDARHAGPLDGLHRLRITPPAFSMPVSLDIGAEPAIRRVSLERFAPLGRVDVTLDTPEFAAALEAAAAASAPAASAPGEHLANGGFDDWLAVGDELRETTRASLLGGPSCLAGTADGRRVYVGTFQQGSGEFDPQRALLEPIELGCGAPLEPIELDSSAHVARPTVVVVGDAPARAYVLAHRPNSADAANELAVVDLEAQSVIGRPIVRMPYSGMALAPGAERLLLLRVATTDTGTPGVTAADPSADDGTTFAIDVLDTRAVERHAHDEDPGPPSETDTAVVQVTLEAGNGVAGETSAVFAAGARGQETLLAIGLTGGPGNPGQVCLLTLERPTLPPQILLVDSEPAALAISDDGARVVVACGGGDHRLQVAVDGVVGPPIPLGDRPRAVVCDASGSIAAVLTPSSVELYDLDSRRRLSAVSLPDGSRPSAMLRGSPRLDALAFTDEFGPRFVRLARPALPLDWTLTSGSVDPWCFAGDLGALLGRPPEPEDRSRPTPLRRSSISQLVAVQAGCRYTLQFRGLADQDASVAEVLWRPGGCGLARTDRLPITAFDPEAREADAPAQLPLHRAELEAPADAVQAEVRFVTPAGGQALIGSVSLRGSATIGANEDLLEREAGQPVAWTSEAPGGPLTFTAGAGVLVSNDTAAAAALVQVVAVDGPGSISLELVGRIVASGAEPGPTLAIRSLGSDGAVVGDETAAALSATAFDRLVLEAAAVAGAERAEVRLTLPPGASVEVESLRVLRAEAVDVPVAFRAEAPGELSVRDAVVAYDVGTSPAAVVAGTGGGAPGACPATPPGEPPGPEPAKPACGCCGSHETAGAERRAATPAGNAAALRTCTACGGQAITFGGVAASAPTIRPSAVLAHARGTGLVDVVAPMHALTMVRGIGDARAARLARAGIGSAERLAAAHPQVVATLLGNVHVGAAARIVENAGLVAATTPQS